MRCSRPSPAKPALQLPESPSGRRWRIPAPSRASLAAVQSERIVVLGCGVTAAGEPSPALQRRVASAAMAWRAGLAPVVIASGGRRWWGHPEALVMREALVALGVPPAAIQVELCSLTTRENAFYCHRLMSRDRALTQAQPEVVLVSCDWHLPRALANFERAGVHCKPYPAPAPRSGLWRLRRARETMRGTIDRLTDGLLAPCTPGDAQSPTP